MSKIIRCLLLLSIILSCSNDSLGDQENVNFLSNLKNHFDEAVKSERYSSLMEEAENKAFKCDSIQDTVSFLELANIKTANVDFQEDFAETIEKLCLTKPDCFLTALSKCNDKTVKAVLSILKIGMYHDPSEIKDVFDKYKHMKKYKHVMLLYYGSENLNKKQINTGRVR